MKNRWRIMIGAGFLAVAAVAIRWQWGRNWQWITVGKDTTWVTGPLRADGTVDYIGALNEKYGEGVTAENNAAAPLFLLVGEWYPEVKRAQIAEMMHAPEIAATQAAGVRFEPWIGYRQRMAGGEAEPSRQGAWYDELGELSKNPWTEAEHPEAAAWLKANAGALEKLEEAVGRPRWFFPMLRQDECTTVLQAEVGPLGALRELGTALAARGMKRMAEGDAAGAWRDSILAVRLGYLLARQPNAIGRLVGLAVIDLGLQLEGKILAEKLWSGADAARLREELDKLGEPPSFVECIQWEDRLMALDNLTMLARFGPDAEDCSGGMPAPAGPFAFGLVPVQFDPVLRNANAWMDRLTAAATERRFASREAALEKVRAEAKLATPSLGSSSQAALKNLSMISVNSDYRKRFRIQASVEQMRELLMHALRGVEYFAGHELTEEAVAAWGRSLPTDLFAEKAIRVGLRSGVVDLGCDGPEPLFDPGMPSLGIAATTPARRDFRVEVRVRDGK